MGKLCKNHTCKQSRNRHCNEFSQEDCKHIFTAYWKTGDKKMQNTFIRSLVDTAVKKMQKTDYSNRQFSHVFHLKKDGLPKIVCKGYVLGTLGISSK